MRMVRLFPGAALLFALFVPLAAAADGVDAVTAASVDAETGASRQLEEVKVGGDFGVAYAVNDDGALFITAPNLADAYRRDELASDSIFKGKDMVVRGTVEKMSKPDAAKPWITLVGDGASGKKIRCALAAGGLKEKTAAPGDVIQVRGVCEGMKLNVSLAEARIIE